MFKVNNKSTRTTSSGVFIVNFKEISHLFLVFLLLPLNRKMFDEECPRKMRLKVLKNHTTIRCK